MKTLEVLTPAEWRDWLAANHDQESEIWLIFHKKETGLPSIAYSDALDEALCYGWVDSLIKRLDDARYARKFTPRKDNSQWSVVNKKRVVALIRDGRMTDHGLKKVAAAQASGKWEKPVQKPVIDLSMPPEFAAALKQNPQAEAFFAALRPSLQAEYLRWINTARRPETRERRIAAAVRLLGDEQTLGLR